jgi:hypothetical protein
MVSVFNRSWFDRLTMSGQTAGNNTAQAALYCRRS